jgi:hypothetical protein
MKEEVQMHQHYIGMSLAVIWQKPSYSGKCGPMLCENERISDESVNDQ